MRLLTLVFVFLLSPAFSQDAVNAGKPSLNNFAIGGLSIRKSADKSSDKVGDVPYGKSVLVLERTGNFEKIGGLDGEWLKIQYSDMQGFIFDTYLSDYPIPAPTEEYPYFKEYLFQFWGKRTNAEPFEVPEDYPDIRKSMNFGPLKYEIKGSSCDLEETIYIPQISLQKAFVIFSAAIPLYSDQSLNPEKFELGEEGYSRHYTVDKEPFPLEFHIVYNLDKSKKHRALAIYFDWEGGGGSIAFKQLKDNSVRVKHYYGCH